MTKITYTKFQHPNISNTRTLIFTSISLRLLLTAVKKIKRGFTHCNLLVCYNHYVTIYYLN